MTPNLAMLKADARARRGTALGLMAAILFGLSTPLAKLLLPESGAIMLAALLYLGAGGGLLAFGSARYRAARLTTLAREPGLTLADAPLIVGVIIAGGIVGPVLMLCGLSHLSASATALMLNLEVPFTIFLATTFFGEHLGRRDVLGAALIIVGGLVLSWPAGTFESKSGITVGGDLTGVLALGGACFSWALDNNLTQRLSARDPVAVARIKTLGAGLCTLALAYASGQSLPTPRVYVSALLVGLLSYGLSLVLYVYAQRMLGAARQAGLFAIAPFIGALASIVLIDETFSVPLALGGLLMACGLWAMFSEVHVHNHFHDALVHNHLHVHDLHHQHDHDSPCITEQPHAHQHRHVPTFHAHPHLPDAHHRHRHS
jgi:drug/metabolite transporter (DMT)-like permease